MKTTNNESLKACIINICLIMLCSSQYAFSIDNYCNTDRYAMDKKFNYLDLICNNGEECAIKFIHDSKIPKKITVKFKNDTNEDNISSYNVMIAPVNNNKIESLINIPKTNYYKFLGNKTKRERNVVQEELDTDIEEQDNKTQISETDWISKFHMNQIMNPSNDDVNNSREKDSFYNKLYNNNDNKENKNDNKCINLKTDFLKDVCLKKFSKKDNNKKINITTDVINNWYDKKENDVMDNSKEINLTTDVFEDFWNNKNNKKENNEIKNSKNNFTKNFLLNKYNKKNNIGNNITIKKIRSRNKPTVCNNLTYDYINNKKIFNNTKTNKKYIVEFNNVKKKNTNNTKVKVNSNTKKHINNDISLKNSDKTTKYTNNTSITNSNNTKMITNNNGIKKRLVKNNTDIKNDNDIKSYINNNSNINSTNKNKYATNNTKSNNNIEKYNSNTDIKNSNNTKYRINNNIDIKKKNLKLNFQKKEIKPLDINVLLQSKSNKNKQNSKDNSTMLQQIQREYNNFNDSIKEKILRLEIIHNRYENKHNKNKIII